MEQDAQWKPSGDALNRKNFYPLKKIKKQILINQRLVVHPVEDSAIYPQAWSLRGDLGACLVWEFMKYLFFLVLPWCLQWYLSFLLQRLSLYYFGSYTAFLSLFTFTHRCVRWADSLSELISLDTHGWFHWKLSKEQALTRQTPNIICHVEEMESSSLL